MARGVILGSPDIAKHPHRIYVPRGLAGERQVIGRCTIPGCDARFYSGEAAAMERHGVECFRLHEAEILAAAPSRNRTIETPDPEVEAHMRKVGKRMLEEGRWTVNDNERAGFS